MPFFARQKTPVRFSRIKGVVSRFSLYRDRAALVEKDVLRTDRALDFYKGENNTHVDDLYEMLMTYCQYNFDLGW